MDIRTCFRRFQQEIGPSSCHFFHTARCCGESGSRLARQVLRLRQWPELCEIDGRIEQFDFGPVDPKRSDFIAKRLGLDDHFAATG